jgi:stage II sporulation protein D
MTRTLRISCLAVAACLLAAAPALAAKARFTIRGAGFGHGVGMSQYGAYGFAQQGATYDEILRHYYTDTELGTTDPSEDVRVLLQSSRGSTSFSGAARAGTRRLSPGKTYLARGRSGDRVDLLSSRGRRIATFSAPLQVIGSGGSVRLGGVGSYRGMLEFRPGTFGGVNAINAVSLEEYVAGVISRESPASWPLEALKAQAVAARTYAITSSKAGAGFEHYPDTRSQVYGGVAAETARTNEAVAETRGQVVTYDGEPVTTYFFSTSGGRTEDVENTSLGDEPLPWLKSVEDPYDDVSPKHRWGPIKLTIAQAQAKLGGLVKGRLKGVEVLERGSSPRIVEADVVGTRGRTRVDGATLRARLGLLDTWAYFTSIATRKRAPDEDRRGGAPDEDTGGDRTGGATPEDGAKLSSGPRPVAAITGAVVPARRGAEVQIQVRNGSEWTTVASTVVRRGGRYRAEVARPGTYRAVFSGEAGPSVRVR